ncbi:MAG: ATP-binding cassette domain-containing protein [Saprospiraceae bacterium]
MIQLENITKSYGTKKVLKGINLDLEKGKVYGIVGENGAGKTTLFKCIAGLEPFEGDLNSDFQPLKNHLGLLETNPAFLSRITGWEYFEIVMLRQRSKQEDFEAQNIFELPLDLYAESYSTGMKKKLAFMAILLQKNEVFILDEPFNGVDIQSNILITELILKLKSLGKTVIIFFPYFFYFK